LQGVRAKEPLILANGVKRGATVHSVASGFIERLQIPLPPLPEQRRIVEVMQRAAGIRRLRQAALAKARETIPALFLKMFGDPATNPMGWPVLQLGDLTETFRYGTSTKCTEVEEPGCLPVLRIPNVIGDAIDWSDLKFATLSAAEVQRLSLVTDDLLFVRTNGNPAYLGRCVRFDGDRTALFASYLIRARLKENGCANATFVREAMISDAVRQVLLRQSKTTAGNFNLSIGGLEGIKLPVPPLALQQAFATRLTALRGIIAQQERALETARAAEASLLARLLG
jgi:type I restriction enzyme S subunit